MFCCFHRGTAAPALPGRYRRAAAWLLLAMLAAPAAQADDDDTRRLLDDASRTMEQFERPEWTPLQPQGELSVIVDGQPYRLERTLQDLEPALYIAINTGQWNTVRALVEAYRQLDGHEPHLALMAEGLAARHAGDYGAAIERLERAHDAAPDDMRTQMELARAYAEDNQDHEARRLFERALSNSLPADTRDLLQQYVDAVDERGRWQGSMALGVGYSDNVNQANGYRQCAWDFAGHCLGWLELPEPMDSPFMRYDLVASKRIALGGHHNLLIRPVSHGTLYRERAEASATLENYSDNTSLLYLGYQFANARLTANLLPYVENYYRNGRTSYRTPGLQTNWRYFLIPKLRLSLQAGIKRLHYRGEDSELYADYTRKTSSLTAAYYLGDSTQLYGGIDFHRNDYANEVHSSEERAFRAGVFHRRQDIGVFANLMVQRKHFENDAHNFFYGVRREDTQDAVIATLGFPKLSIFDAYPELRFKHVDNDSNTIHHGYRQNEVTLQWRLNF